MRLPGWAHAAIWLTFGALVLLPPVWLAVDALGAGSAQGVELLSGDQWRLFGRSLGIAAGAASLALVLGVPYAVLCERTDLPGRSLWMLAGLLPLLIPAFVHALTWARLLAPNRPVAAWLQAQLGGWAPSIHSPAGAALVLALAHLPFVIVLAQAGLRSVDCALEEAAALALGVALSLRALGSGPVRIGLDLLSQLPFAVAPILLGIGLIKVWNHPATFWLYGGAGMLVIGYLVRLAPFAVRVLDAALAQVADSQLEAAWLAMGGWRLLWRVLLPLLRRGLAVTLLLCFVLALGELGLALLITPPGLTPIPIEIYNYLHYGAEARVAALCLILIAAQLGLIALLYPLWRRSEPSTTASRRDARGAER